MIWNDLVQKMICIFLTVLGLVANVLILVRLLYTLSQGLRKKIIDVILIHLTFSNVLILCTIVIGDTAKSLYFKNFLGEAGYKIVFFLARMSRGLSICTTCLLSMFQAATINPRTNVWRKLKPQTAGQVLPYFLLFWILNSLISSNLLYYITAVRQMNRSGIGMYGAYWYILPSTPIVRWLFISLMAVRDVIFQSLMGWSSGSMALHLYKHHRRVFYLHSSKGINNYSPEIRATQSTLVLMACFLFFYWVDFIFSSYMGFIKTNDSKILMIKPFVDIGYAVLSPFVLIRRDVHVAKSGSAH